MTSPRTNGHRRVGRRVAVGGLGIATALALGVPRRAAAQPVNLADHPMAGSWLAMANPPLPGDPQTPGPANLAADGTFLGMFPVTQHGPQGVVYNTPYVGVWEADSERRAHFTAVQVLSDADGNLTGTITVDGYPEASEDGQTFSDDGSRVMVTIRDPAGVIVQQIMPTGQPVGRPVTGVKMRVGAPGFPDTGAATPTS
ncbi:MAG: hypothetical protein U0Z70_16645 [Thermomicrobiales bacterium]